MSKSLFQDFDSVSSKQWKQKIQVDLKGADYNESLIWKTNEGIDVKPFYHSDQFDGFIEIPKSGSGWKIGQSIEVQNATDANEIALDCIRRGAEAITFIVSDENLNIQRLLQGINQDIIPIHIKTTFLSKEFALNILQLSPRLQSRGLHLYTDIIGNLARTGNWYNNLKKDHEIFEAIVEKTCQISIDIALYQNAGATMVQQLTYALAHAIEYLNHFENAKNKSLSKVDMTFMTSVGTNYFFEIAKLRALRLLWQTIASEFNANPKCRIIASPTKRNKTIYDYNTNMLRTTTECMSAILGGADEIYNLPYDALYHKSNEFGDRISRNQLLVLKNESYFDKVGNAADGSYYIEELTEQLANKALELVKDIERNGGFLSQLKEGTTQRKIKESAAKEQGQFDSNALILLGTNKHPNKADRMHANLEISPFVVKKPRKTIIEPILEKRLASKLEIERLKDEEQLS